MVAREFTSPAEITTRLLPVYILCDTSQSMQADGAIDKMNEGLAGVVTAINEQGHKGDDIRLSVVKFSTQAEVVLPLTHVGMETTIPPLRAGGVTNLADAVNVLSAALERDYHALRDARERAYRPAVFVFTDGRPTDQQGNELTDHSSWITPLNRLKENRVWGPRIFAYGFGDAQYDQLVSLVHESGASGRRVSGDLARDRIKFTGAEAAESIKRLFPLLFLTIVEAADAAASGATDDQIGQILDKAHKQGLDDDPEGWWGGKS